ncbi:MAG: dihydrodipicolinate synthase family protein [Acetobacteraceae bacterium]|nr:dihydrodipicolinate synthase family protein [Acetobacteraceae bacterium]
MLSPTTKGVYAIAPTPFLEDGRIDFASIGHISELYAAAGCTGITVLGIMGEALKLDADEAVEVTRAYIRATTLPVVVGVSSPGFASMKALARSAMDLGAAGVMISAQPSLRTDDDVINYFRNAAEAIGADTPWIVQDYPLTTNVKMTASVIERIITDNPNCKMLKAEDWPGLDKLTALRQSKSERIRDIPILCGNGALFLDFEMERGASGSMTGYAFPEMLVDVVRFHQEGQRDAAHDLFDAHLPLLRYEQQLAITLAVRKYVMQRRGMIASAAQRKPGSALTPKARAEVDYLLSRLARLDPNARPFAA